MISEPAAGHFFGREEILRVLEKRVTALKGGYRQNVALTGQMLAGKSSILHRFLGTLEDTELVPIYIEVIPEPFPLFAGKFIATLLYSYLVSCGLAAAKDLSELMAKAEPRIPHTIHAVRKIKSELSKKRFDDTYRKLLSLTSILKRETGKSCIVILDEFHNLEFTKIKNSYLHFGKIIMIQKDTMYIVSSSQKSTFKKILSEKLALLYGNFEIIEVSGFDDKTAYSFLKESLGSVSLPQCYADYLIDFTDGNPFYLDVISKKIVSIANQKNQALADGGLIMEAFTALLYNTSGTINQYFTNTIMSLLEKDLRRDYLDVLIAVSRGLGKLKEIAAHFGKKDAGAFAKKLARLAELDMVYKSGVFYDMHDKVFKFWLKTVYHKKATSLVDDVMVRTSDFKKDVASDMDEYLSESRKKPSDRVRDLFGLFNGETVEIERKKRRLPHFVKIEALQYGNAEDIVSYEGPNKYWVFQVTEKSADEAAVADFIERYHPMRDKISRKICVALLGVDENALLLAKEKNIWVWDLKNINGLLRLYKKRRLIAR